MSILVATANQISAEMFYEPVGLFSAGILQEFLVVLRPTLKKYFRRRLVQNSAQRF